jgi:DNA adenine methylase
MLEAHHLSLPELEDKAQHYYHVRDQYNSASFHLMSPAARAAVYIFLNKSGYNGLYRENSAGIFNVPHGKRMEPPILQAEKLRKASAAMASIVVEAGDFSRVLEVALPGDFVLLDAPYHGSFTSYSRQKFDWGEQLRVFQVCQILSDMGVYWMMTNSDTPAMRALYGAYHVETVMAPRKVSGKTSGRGNVSELIATNYPPSFYKGA